jgi:small redox-active disulfide protein 2
LVKVQILGTGCPKCKKLEENARAALEASGLEFELAKVTDINEIIGFGVMMTPGLVIDGDVKSAGKLLTAEEIEELLK